MATTSVGTDRPSNRALELYPDAAFIRDDKKLYFGDGGDFSIWYDETTDDVVKTAGADIRLSDTQQIQFGDDNDANLRYNAASDCFHLSGKTIKITLTSDLILVGLPTVASDVVTGGLYLTTNSDVTLKV